MVTLCLPGTGNSTGSQDVVHIILTRVALPRQTSQLTAPCRLACWTQVAEQRSSSLQSLGPVNGINTKWYLPEKIKLLQLLEHRRVSELMRPTGDNNAACL